MALRLTWLGLALLLTVTAAPAQAQVTPDPFAIRDNSFLIEEAFNQDPGIFQSILVFSRASGDAWEAAFTQEFPVRSLRHQLSYTVPFTVGGQEGRLGAILVNYRLQWLEEGRGRPAIAPRFSLQFPERGDVGGWGVQFNLPVSRRAGRLYLHGNLGLTLQRAAALAPGGNSPFGGGSLIVALRPLINALCEVLVERPAGASEARVTISPGLRIGWNIGSKQVVVGAAVPFERGSSDDVSLLGYLSYELPFRGR